MICLGLPQGPGPAKLKSARCRRGSLRLATRAARGRWSVRPYRALQLCAGDVYLVEGGVGLSWQIKFNQAIAGRLWFCSSWI